MKVRAAAHVHSDWSYDGSWSLQRIASFFKGAGYRCVFTSEHDNSFTNDRWRCYREYCTNNSNGDFLIVPGIEYSDPMNVVHVLVWGNIPFLGARRDTEEVLREVKEYNGVAVLAHPSRKQAWQEFRSQWVPLLIGVEQWNRKVDGVAPSPEAIAIIKQNPQLFPFVGLDFHRINQFFPLAMTLELSGELVEDVIISSLLKKKAKAEVAGIPIDCFSKGLLFKTVGCFEFLRQNISKSFHSK